MRNKRETDISQYKDIQPEINPAVRKVNPIKDFSRRSVNLFLQFSRYALLRVLSQLFRSEFTLRALRPNRQALTSEQNRLTRQVLLWYKIQTVSLNSIKLFTAQKTEFGLTTKRFRRL